MAGGISIHAVDVASGRPAEGLRIEIVRIEPAPARIAEGRLGTNGQLDHPVVNGSGIEVGEYEVRFHIGEFFAGDKNNIEQSNNDSIRSINNSITIWYLRIFDIQRLASQFDIFWLIRDGFALQNQS